MADWYNAKQSMLFKSMEELQFQIPVEYKWSKDPLHHWSRIWEYPWVFNQIRGKTILDAGSGITFFPNFLRSFQCEVTPLDSDKFIAQFMNGIHGSIETHQGQYDNVICVSVIEHTKNPFKALENLKECVAPGGRLIITVDVGINGAEMNRVDFKNFASEFGFKAFPPLTNGDYLTTRTVKEGLPGPTHMMKKLTSFVRRGHPLAHIPYLTVCGLMWEKPC